jgi:hypothetical protein
MLMALVLLLVLYGNAHAYLGPGAGLGVIGAFVGTVVAVVLAIVGVIWYPAKRLIGKFRGEQSQGNEPGGKERRT